MGNGDIEFFTRTKGIYTYPSLNYDFYECILFKIEIIYRVLKKPPVKQVAFLL